jgi:hypothetical protein
MFYMFPFRNEFTVYKVKLCKADCVIQIHGRGGGGEGGGSDYLSIKTADKLLNSGAYSLGS